MFALFQTARRPDGAFLAGTVIAWAVLVFLWRRSTASAARSRGRVRPGTGSGAEHLANGRFTDQPAAGVTIWGRGLAYAAALGLADRAVVSLPISTPADDSRAWSDYGGMWHLVHVSTAAADRGAGSSGVAHPAMPSRPG